VPDVEELLGDEPEERRAARAAGVVEVVGDVEVVVGRDGQPAVQRVRGAAVELLDEDVTGPAGVVPPGLPAIG
jgi:hypothetical protein